MEDVVRVPAQKQTSTVPPLAPDLRELSLPELEQVGGAGDHSFDDANSGGAGHLRTQPAR